MSQARTIPIHRVNHDARIRGVTVDAYVQEMRIANYSPVTIRERVKLLERFAATVDGTIFDATAENIREFQASLAHLSPASVNIYARHLRAFLVWAARQQRVDAELVDVVVVPKIRKGRPHPTSVDDLRTILACATGGLRLAYVLAAFAGLRCGEVCRLQRSDLDLAGPAPTALINGKGGRERVIPLLPPVVDELLILGRVRWVITRGENARPWKPKELSKASSMFLSDLGIETTFHSMRHAFATAVVQATRDPMLVRDLLGHESVATSEIYMLSSLDGAHARMAAVSDTASSLLRRGHLRAVSG